MKKAFTIALLCTAVSSLSYAEESVTTDSMSNGNTEENTMTNAVSLENFTFDRYVDGLNASITPKGRVALQQALPTANYYEQKVDGQTHKITTLQTDSLVRIGIGHEAEVRVGWQGLQWQRNKTGSLQHDENHIGDMSVAIKKRLLNDSDMQWSVLAQADLATGSSYEHRPCRDKYSVISAVDYQYSELIQTAITMKYDYQKGDLGFTTVPSIRYKLTDHAKGYFEYVGHKQESQKSTSQVNHGILFNYHNKAQFDMWFGYGFNDVMPRYRAGLGVSYLF
ncbi:transporter [Acinetobacter sp. c1-l78]|uniref:transporter n=1 Tax=Acinetobacter sp. c1-l78 TaxID=3342803 RepID=UPI0035BA6F01